MNISRLLLRRRLNVEGGCQIIWLNLVIQSLVMIEFKVNAGGKGESSHNVAEQGGLTIRAGCIAAIQKISKKQF
ncbi:hypothetical protein ABKV19_021779 [Rosa sericea]